MKNGQRRKISLLSLLILLFCQTCLTGCEENENRLEDYSAHYEDSKSVYMGEINQGMAQDLAVITQADSDLSANVKAALTINDDTDEVLLSYHAFDKL